MYKNFKEDRGIVLGISIDRVTTRKDIPLFVRRLGMSFPVPVDFWGQTNQWYMLKGIPKTCIFDQQGDLREKVIGPSDWTRLEKLPVITGRVA